MRGPLWHQGQLGLVPSFVKYFNNLGQALDSLPIPALPYKPPSSVDQKSGESLERIPYLEEH